MWARRIRLLRASRSIPIRLLLYHIRQLQRYQRNRDFCRLHCDIQDRLRIDDGLSDGRSLQEYTSCYSSHKIGYSDGWYEHYCVRPPTQSETLQIPGAFGLWIFYGSFWLDIPDRSVDILLSYQTSDELVVSEITQITPKGPQFTDHTASLIIHPRLDFSKVQIVQDYRAKSILKGLSDVGGLWTFAALIFGTIYGSSLARVVFGKSFVIQSTGFSFFQ